MARRRVRQIVTGVAAVLLLSWLVPTFVRVSYWEQDIVAALARELGRPVRIGPAHLKLLGGPGFEIENVVVEEDPRFGIEPFARTERVRATMAARSLWRGGIEFSTLEFVRPSFNVVRNREGRWNLETLCKKPETSLSGKSVPSANAVRSADGKLLPLLPKIRVDSGRVNFKSQDQKTVYAVESLDLELLPPSAENQPWEMRWSGTPTRTDSSLRALSEFTGRVEFGPFAAEIQKETGWPVRMDMAAENALLGDLLRVVAGDDFGVHGMLDLQFHLAGTTSLLRVSGTATDEDLQRWDLLPPSTSLPLRAAVAGLLDVEAESVQLTSMALPFSKGTVAAQGRIESLFHHPKPELQVQLAQLSLEALASLAKQFTTRLEDRFLAEGYLDGSLQWADSPGLWTGSLSVTDGALREEGTQEALQFSDFEIALEGSKAEIGPVKIQLGEGKGLEGSLEWDIQKRLAKLRLQGQDIAVVPFLHWAGAFGSRWKQLPVTQGRIALQLDLTPVSQSAPLLRGWAQVSEAELRPATFSQPVQVRSARLQFQNRSVRVREIAANVGSLELQGSMRADLSSASRGLLSTGLLSAIEFDWKVNEIDLANLPQLSQPRRRIPFFGSNQSGSGDRTWWNPLDARGSLRVERLRYGGVESENAQAHLQLRDATLEIVKFTSHMAGGTWQGQASVSWAGAVPSIALQAQFSGVDLAKLALPFFPQEAHLSGKLSGGLRLASQGSTRQEIAEHWSGSGQASGRNITLHGWNLAAAVQADAATSPSTRLRSFSAHFQVAKREILLQELRLIPAAHPSDASASYTITGSIGFDQKVELLVQQTPDGPQSHWAGTLTEPLQAVAKPVLPYGQGMASAMPKQAATTSALAAEGK
ncbi:MAG: AsmA family protein [Acidobacteria bacterium]|nr:AsmA family protein [Acidobacteriota bacterium]